MMRKPIACLVALVTIYALSLSVYAGDPVLSRSQDVGRQGVRRHDAASEDVSSQRVSNQTLIGQARGAYYSLARQGFKGFKAHIEPNWEVILAHTATQENLKVFRAVRFSMVVDATGAVKVSHEVDDTDKPRVELYLKQIHDNVERLVAGFFGTWRIFMVNSPFPESESEIKVENLEKEYRLSSIMQSADVMLTMTNEFLITEWKLTSARAKRTIKPQFQKTAEGFLLNWYQTVFEPFGEGIKTSLNFNIEYQDISGMKLPQKIRIAGIHGSEPVEAELIFNQYLLNPNRQN